MTCAEKTQQQSSSDAKVVKARPPRNKRLPVVMDDLAGVVKVPLTRGLFALVDEADLDLVSAHNWCVAKTKTCNYAARGIKIDGKWTVVTMHRLLLQPPPGMVIDHINHNGLDNRRCNLRFATHTQNNQNGRKHKACVSRFIGVAWHRKANKWMAQITVNSEHRYLGLFTDEVEAAKAYDAAALEHFGVFANPNFPNNQNT